MSDQNCSPEEEGKIENGAKIETAIFKNEVSEKELEAMIVSGFARNNL